MAHFAEIGGDRKVLRVVVVDNKYLLSSDGEEIESMGQEFCQKLLGGTWVQTSYNGSKRKNFAGIGYTYDVDLDAFIPPKPYESWVLDEETCLWMAPSPMPKDGKIYLWHEPSLSWAERLND